MSFWVRLSLGLYRLVLSTGLLNLPPVQRLYLRSYFFYKRMIEDPFADLFKRYPGLIGDGSVADVGANVGYTSMVFAGQIQPGNKVFAFEPDGENFQRLQWTLKTYGLDGRVEAFRAAVGATEGLLNLWINPEHPADHRIYTEDFSKSGLIAPKTEQVRVLSLDQELVQKKKAHLSFVKIDVQGYELPVCEGMQRLIETEPELKIVFEYAPDHMRALGFEPKKIIHFFTERNFLLYRIQSGKDLVLINDSEGLKRLEDLQGEYFDLLCSRAPIATRGVS